MLRNLSNEIWVHNPRSIGLVEGMSDGILQGLLDWLRATVETAAVPGRTGVARLRVGGIGASARLGSRAIVGASPAIVVLFVERRYVGSVVRVGLVAIGHAGAQWQALGSTCSMTLRGGVVE